MSTEPTKLPPTERDFAIYWALTHGDESTRKVAAEHSVSQTRVVQIRKEVIDWMADVLPETDHIPAEKRLRVAEQIADERMLVLYGNAMEAWRGSQGTKTTTRHSERTGDTITTTRECSGEPRHLQQALRIAQAQLKLAVRDRRTQEALLAAQSPPGTLLAGPAVATQSAVAPAPAEPKPEKPKYFSTPFVPLPEDIVVPGGVIVIDLDDDPPARDCSASSAVAVPAEPARHSTAVANQGPATLSDKQREQRAAFLAGNSAPQSTVQSK